MKLKPTVSSLEVKLEGFNFQEVFEKTLKEVKSSYFDSPELFISTFVSNSEHLQKLGDSNGYEDIDQVIKKVIEEIKKLQLKGDTELGLAKLVVKTLGMKYEKPKAVEKTTSNTVSKTVGTTEKPTTTEYELEEGLMGLEIKYDKKTVLDKEEFEQKIKEVHGDQKQYEFEYTETKVTVTVSPLKTETKEAKETKETKETGTKLFTVETSEDVDPDDEDAEPTFVIRKPDGNLLEDETGDNDGEPQVFDTEEEAEQLAKELNKSILEEANKDAKPKKEKKLKQPKVEKKVEVKEESKQETETTEEATKETEEVKVEEVKVEEPVIEKEVKEKKIKKEEKVVIPEDNEDLDW